jgi:hypothetical protein
MRVGWLDRLKTPEQPSLPEVAIRLADEGVPLAVIARVTRIPSSELREQLQAAQGRGQLLELPPHDWFPRDCPSRQALAEDRARQVVALRVLFGTTRTEASLLMELVRQGSLCRARYPSSGAVDVHVVRLRRKLAPHGVKVVSVHGHGFRLMPADRERLQNMLERARSAA